MSNQMRLKASLSILAFQSLSVPATCLCALLLLASPPLPDTKQGSQPTEMRAAWGINVIDDDVCKLAVQMGVRDVVLYGGPGAKNLPGTAQALTKPRAEYSDYLAARQRLESFGLRLAAIEGGFLHLPKYHDVAFSGPKRDELIQELLNEIHDMARAGVPIYGYHWMPLLVWRTEPVQIRGGAEATAFDLERVRHIKDQESCKEMRELLRWGFMTCEALPAPGEPKYSEEDLWRNLKYWIEKVTPVAEKEGIRLGIHPDDPPTDELAGLPRIMRDHAAYRRLIEIYPSDSNAIEFCQGTFSEMRENVYDAIRYFGSRNKILYVHFRNVSAPVPKFNEEFVNTGYVDMYRAMKAHRDAGFKGVFIDDHCPIVHGDTPFPGNLGGYRSRLFALGYIQALIEAVTKELARR
jgi:mannonate dehydratase